MESGDVLATLDDLLITELTQRSAQQVLALDNAGEQLEDLHRNHEQQLARAKQAVAQAEFALDLAQDRLDDFQRDYNTKLARATQANAAAGLTLDQTIEDLEDFQSEHSQKLAVAAEARAAAELALDQALDTLANADFNYGQTLAAALQAVASAELARDRAQEDLDEFQREHLRQHCPCPHDDRRRRSRPRRGRWTIWPITRRLMPKTWPTHYWLKPGPKKRSRTPRTLSKTLRMTRPPSWRWLARP